MTVVHQAVPATFRRSRGYVSGALSQEDLAPLRAAACHIRVVPAAGHVLMWDDPRGFAAAVVPARQ